MSLTILQNDLCFLQRLEDIVNKDIAVHKPLVQSTDIIQAKMDGTLQVNYSDPGCEKQCYSLGASAALSPFNVRNS